MHSLIHLDTAFSKASSECPSPANIAVAYCPFMLCSSFFLFWARNPGLGASLTQVSLIAEVRLGLVHEIWEERGSGISSHIFPYWVIILAVALSLHDYNSYSQLLIQSSSTYRIWVIRFPLLALLSRGNNEFLLLRVSGCHHLADSLTPTHNSAISPFSKTFWAGFWILQGLRSSSLSPQIHKNGNKNKDIKLCWMHMGLITWFELIYCRSSLRLNIQTLISVIISHTVQLLSYGRINHEGILLYLGIMLI